MDEEPLLTPLPRGACLNGVRDGTKAWLYKHNRTLAALAITARDRYGQWSLLDVIREDKDIIKAFPDLLRIDTTRFHSAINDEVMNYVPPGCPPPSEIPSEMQQQQPQVSTANVQGNTYSPGGHPSSANVNPSQHHHQQPPPWHTSAAHEHASATNVAGAPYVHPHNHHHHHHPPPPPHYQQMPFTHHDVGISERSTQQHQQSGQQNNSFTW